MATLTVRGNHKNKTENVCGPTDTRAKISGVATRVRYNLPAMLLPLLLAGLVSCAGVTSPGSKSGGGSPSSSTLAASVSSLSFGQEPLGKTSTAQTLTITNTGSAQTNIQSISCNNSSFTYNGPALPAALPPSQSVQVSVSFDPKSPGSISGVLSIASDASDSTLGVDVSGKGAAPVVSVSPASIPFGNEVVNSKSSSHTVTVSNSGLLAMNVTQVSVSASQFIASGPTAPYTIQPGSSVSYAVAFNPTAAQGYSGALSIASNAFNGPASSSLSGTGISASTATVSVSPGALSFSSMPVGNTSNPQMLTIKNTGSAQATIQTISSNNASFSYSGISLPAAIGPSSSVQLAVSFDPKAPGAASGNLSISGSANNLPASVGLTGTGEAAVISVGPSSVNFGNETQNATSGSQSISVSNTGNASLSINSVGISPAQFAYSGPTPPLTILPGNNVTYNVTFTPAATQAYSGSMTFTSNAFSGSGSVSMAGTGVSATSVLNITPSSIPFGNQLLNTTSSARSVSVQNGGNTSVTINQVSVPSGPFAVTGFSGNTTLATGQSMPLSVTYTPNAQTGDSATLSVSGTSSDGSPVSASVSLTGIGVTQSSSVPNCGLKDDDLPHMPSDWATFTPPSSVGGTYMDALGAVGGGTGCTVKRLTVGGSTAHYYSTTEPMNSNDTYVFVAGSGTCGSGGGWCVIDTNGNVIVSNAHMPGNDGGGLFMWSPNPSTPNLFYYATGNKLMSGTITGTNAVTTATIHTFPEYSFISIPDETRISYDGTTIGLAGEHTGTGTVQGDIFSFNLTTMAKSYLWTSSLSGSCVITGAPTIIGSTDILGGCVHKVIMSTDNRLLVEWHSNTDSGMDAGCKAAFAAGYSCKSVINSNGTLTNIMQGTTHTDSFLSLDGTKNMYVMLWDPSPLGSHTNDPCIDQGGHTVMDESTLATNCLFTTSFTGGHVSTSGTGPNQPWILISFDDANSYLNGHSVSTSPEHFTSSNYTAPTTLFNQFEDAGLRAPYDWYTYESEIIMVRADSAGNTTKLGGTSGKVYRLAWSRTRDSGSAFWGQQRAAISFDGKYVIFSSSMAYPAGNCSNVNDLGCDDVYMIGPLF